MNQKYLLIFLFICIFSNQNLQAQLKNLALGASTYQSSTFKDSKGNLAVSSRAVDGITDGDYWGAGSVTHTEFKGSHSLTVSLRGEDNWMQYINVYNRTDCCKDRLYFKVKITEPSGRIWYTSPFHLRNDSKITILYNQFYLNGYVYTGSQATNLIRVKKCEIISLNTDQPLSVAEIEIMGKSTPSPRINHEAKYIEGEHKSTAYNYYYQIVNAETDLALCWLPSEGGFIQSKPRKDAGEESYWRFEKIEGDNREAGDYYYYIRAFNSTKTIVLNVNEDENDAFLTQQNVKGGDDYRWRVTGSEENGYRIQSKSRNYNGVPFSIAIGGKTRAGTQAKGRYYTDDEPWNKLKLIRIAKLPDNLPQALDAWNLADKNKLDLKGFTRFLNTWSSKTFKQIEGADDTCWDIVHNSYTKDEVKNHNSGQTPYAYKWYYEQVSGKYKEEALIELAKTTKLKKDFTDYLYKCVSCKYKEYANAQIDELEWNFAKEVNEPHLYESYLKNPKYYRFTKEAENALNNYEYVVLAKLKRINCIDTWDNLVDGAEADLVWDIRLNDLSIHNTYDVSPTNVGNETIFGTLAIDYIAPDGFPISEESIEDPFNGNIWDTRSLKGNQSLKINMDLYEEDGRSESGNEDIEWIGKKEKSIKLSELKNGIAKEYTLNFDDGNNNPFVGNNICYVTFEVTKMSKRAWSEYIRVQVDHCSDNSNKTYASITKNAPGFLIRNETDFELDVSLEQIGPLYYGIVKPGDYFFRKTGAVWFTIAASTNIDGKEKYDTWDCVWPAFEFTTDVLLAAFSLGSSAGLKGGVYAAYMSATQLAYAEKAGQAAKLVYKGQKQVGNLETIRAISKSQFTEDHTYTSMMGCYAGWSGKLPIYRVVGGPQAPCITDEGDIQINLSLPLCIVDPDGNCSNGSGCNSSAH